MTYEMMQTYRIFFNPELAYRFDPYSNCDCPLCHIIKLYKGKNYVA